MAEALATASSPPQRQWPMYMSRKEAAAYLTSRGYPITAKTLANRASMGNGPAFRRVRLTLVEYARADLDVWRARQVEIVG